MQQVSYALDLRHPALSAVRHPFICGVMATLALPPFFLLPLLIPSLSGLYRRVVLASSARAAFVDGWWWGMGFFISGLYWFCIALLTDPEKFAWLIPFTLLGLNAIIALYPAVACALFRRIGVTGGVSGVLVFAGVWTAVEWVRGHAFSGFPWNLPGYVFTAFDTTLQLASLVGAYGLTWLAVLLATLPALLAERSVSYRRAAMVVAGAYALFFIAVGWGYGRLAGNPTAYVPDVMLRLVQANIDQAQKWDPAKRMQGVHEHIRLTQSPGIERVTHVIWPETAVPYPLTSDPALAKMLGRSMPESALLITGALRVDQPAGGGDWDMFNSLVALDHRGAVAAHYDKHRLVPFGEFIPLRRLIPDSLSLPVGEKDFAQGPRGVTLDIPNNIPMLPLICYEAIFPELAVHDPSFPAPAWILNVTNDAWFGDSAGPHQHFHMARMRAVETGLPLVRAANTGISAVIDGMGRAIQTLPLGEEGIIDSALPRAVAGSFYARLGDSLLYALIFLTCLLIIDKKRSLTN